MSLNGAIKQIIPKNFVLLTSGTYHGQQLRSWELVGNISQVNGLANHIASTGAISVAPDMIGKVAPGLLQVGLHHQGNIPIASGWNNQRAVFILKFEVEYTTNNVVEWVVQGYTDVPGYTQNAVDPNMVFYINNVFAFARTRTMFNGIASTQTRLMADYQIMNGFSGGAMGQPGGNLLNRPQDMFSRISSQELAGFARVTDGTVLANVGVQTSRHTNNIATNMLADTMNAWHQAAVDVDVTHTQGAIAETAYAKMIELEAEKDLFLSILQKHNNNGAVSSSFRGGLLMKAIPGLMSVYQPSLSTGADVRWSSPGDAVAPGGQSMENSLINNIQAMLPSMMVESMLSTVSFTVTNNQMNNTFMADMRGGPQFTRHGMSAFSPELGEQGWAQFTRRFERDILPLFNLGKGYSLQISCTFFHEIDIWLKMDNEVRVIAPAFCNALFAPVQTTSTNHAEQLATDFGTMVNEVNEALMESQMRRANKTNQAISSIARAAPSQQFPMPQHASIPTLVNIPSPAPVHHGGGSMTLGGHSATVAAPAPAPAGQGSMFIKR